MLGEQVVLEDDGSVGEHNSLLQLAAAIHGPERFIGLIGAGRAEIIEAAIAELKPAVGFIRLRNFPASPLTLERIVTEISGALPSSPDSALTSVDRGLARRAGINRRIVLVLDQAQDLSTDTLLFLQALPYSTAYGTPVLKILFVADASFWALIGSDLFDGIRERSAEPVILEPRGDREFPICFSSGSAIATATAASDATPVGALIGDDLPPPAISGYLRFSPWIWLVGILTLTGITVTSLQTRTTTDIATEPMRVLAPIDHDANLPIEVQPVGTTQPVPLEPSTSAMANSVLTDAERQNDLRRDFNAFLSSRSLTHLSTTQRDHLFRQYLASRAQKSEARP